MAWDDRPKDLTDPPEVVADRLQKAQERHERLSEPRCYCGKTNSDCIADNGSGCHHPSAAAHMWGD